MKHDREGPLAGISRFLRRVPRQERARAVVEAILTAADESLHAVEGGAMMRAGADALTGLAVVSAFREPAPSLDEVALAAGDVGWGVVQVHLMKERFVHHETISGPRVARRP